MVADPGTDQMEIVVVGPGALGCLFTSLLSKGLHRDVDQLWLLDHRQSRAEKINSQGLIYEKDNRREQIDVRACSDPEIIGHPDVILFCVKSYDLKKAIKRCKPLITSKTLLLFLQNGITHLQEADQISKEAIPVFGTSSEGATLVDTGHVRHCGSGVTFFGFLAKAKSQSLSTLQHVVEILNRGGIVTEITETIKDRLWAKLFVNVGINALTAIHRTTNGRLLESDTLKTKMRSAIIEACAVAEANNVVIGQDPLLLTFDICQKTGKNHSSMFQDTKYNRKTEIDAINGAVVVEGKRLGLKTPVNLDLVQKIKAIEKKYSSEG